MTNQDQQAHYVVRYAKSFLACEIENSEDLKLQLQSRAYTEPSHGGGRAFESPRAHCFFSFFDEIGPETDSSTSDEKLSTLQGKLSTLQGKLSTLQGKLSTPAKVSEFTPTREGVIAKSGLASSSRHALLFSNPPIEVEKHTLDDLTLPFTSDDLSYYVERRNIGLAHKSQDWIIRAARNFWYATRGTISRKTLGQFLTITLTKYKSYRSHDKQLAFAKAFLKYLTKIN